MIEKKNEKIFLILFWIVCSFSAGAGGVFTAMSYAESKMEKIDEKYVSKDTFNVLHEDIKSIKKSLLELRKEIKWKNME